MKSIEDIRRDNAATWGAVIDKLRAMGHWVVVEHGPGAVSNQTIVSVQAVPAREATNAAADLSSRAPSAHTISILPPTREPVRTLGDYVRQCEERADRYRYQSRPGCTYRDESFDEHGLPVNCGGTD